MSTTLQRCPRCEHQGSIADKFCRACGLRLLGSGYVGSAELDDYQDTIRRMHNVESELRKTIDGCKTGYTQVAAERDFMAKQLAAANEKLAHRDVQLEDAATAIVDCDRLANATIEAGWSSETTGNGLPVYTIVRMHLPGEIEFDQAIEHIVQFVADTTKMFEAEGNSSYSFGIKMAPASDYE